MIAALLLFIASSGFMPQGDCYLWRPEIVATHVISNAVIALAYWSIPISLLYVVRPRRDVPARWLIGLFAIFIAACGLTHALEVVTVWYPVYIASGLVKVFTAAVSALTAIVLVPLLPRLAGLRSAHELEALNEKLRQEAEDRRGIEQELRRSHAMLEAIVHASPLSIVAVDRDGRVTLWNPAAETLFGWSESEAAGKPPSHIPESEQAAFRRVFEQELQGASFQELETRRQTKAGQMVEIAAWTAPLKIDGEMAGSLHILSDITERKKLERQRAQLAETLEIHVAQRTTELEQANRELTQRNHENELFVYSVSHDLRSPLVNLQGFSQELRRSGDQIRELLSDPRVPSAIRESATTILESDVNESIHYIQTAVTKLSDILMSLLKLSRAGRAEYNWQIIDMNALLADVAALQNADIRRYQAQLHIHVHSAVLADRAAISQVFTQLLVNALRYSEPGLVPNIEIGDLPQSAGAGAQVDESRYRTYYVRDNGLGIPKDHQSKVFQAFQRLHPQVTTGEGIGLALARRIVERHGGKIWFESEAGVGTTFYVSLPIRSAENLTAKPG